MSAPATRFLLARRAGGLASLDLSTGGTFTRTTEASYLTAAPTDGSTAFLAWAIANARRVENRGDGLGDMLLMEGSRTNYLVQSRDLANAAWTAGTGALTGNANGGPDGATLADRINATSGQYGPYQASLAGTGQVRSSVWCRAVAGTTSHQVVTVHNGTTLLAARGLSVTTIWARNDSGAGATANHGILSLDGRDQTAWGGQAAAAQDCYVDLAQAEVGAFPSSPIRTTTAAVTRGADVLSYAVGQYPASFATAGYRVTFAPDFLPADAPAMWLTNGFDAGRVNEGAMLSYNVPGTPRMFVDSALKSSGDFTWAARGQRMTVEIRPSAGTITIAGATTGNGVTNVGAWAFAANDSVRIGSRLADGAGAYFGRFGTTIEAL